MLKRKRIDVLTEQEKAQFPAWVDKWTRVGLCTDPADRSKFESAVRQCYVHAGLGSPKRVVWVDSPHTLAFAAPTAAYVLDTLDGGKGRGAVGGAVGGAVRVAVRVAVRDAVRDAVDDAVRVAVRVAVRDAVGGAVDDAVGGAVVGAVRGAVREAVDDAVVGAVGVAVDDAVREAVGDAVGGAVGEAVRGAVGGAVGGAVREAVGGAVGGAVDDAVGGAVREAVRDAVVGAVGGAVRDAVDDAVQSGWYNRFGGQFWVGGWYWGSPASVSFYEEVLGLDLGDDISSRAKAYRETAESACWWWPHRDFVMVCDRPEMIARDERGRLHNEGGPSIRFRDGWSLWHIHGVAVPDQVVLHPETLTVKQIDAETNAEVKRVMVDRFGHERFLTESGTGAAHTDECGTLYKREIDGDEPLCMVKVRNSTPEPDGTTKDYWLRVDPKCKTAREAVAWTFDLSADEYQPQEQT